MDDDTFRTDQGLAGLVNEIEMLLDDSPKMMQMEAVRKEGRMMIARFYIGGEPNYYVSVREPADNHFADAMQMRPIEEGHCAFRGSPNTVSFNVTHVHPEALCIPDKDMYGRMLMPANRLLLEPHDVMYFMDKMQEYRPFFRPSDAAAIR
jgi:hypothetical protein